MAPAAKPQKAPEKRLDPVVYPTTRIDEDFITRALQGLPDAEVGVQAENDPEPPRAAPRPLSGLMSLGAGASGATP
jgi:hypothetical protein